MGLPSIGEMVKGLDKGKTAPAAEAPKRRVKVVKQYRVRDGFMWLGPEGTPSGQKMVTNLDPGFEGQLHKLEEVSTVPQSRLDKDMGAIADEVVAAPITAVLTPEQIAAAEAAEKEAAKPVVPTPDAKRKVSIKRR